LRTKTKHADLADKIFEKASAADRFGFELAVQGFTDAEATSAANLRLTSGDKAPDLCEGLAKGKGC
jgi:hypothetical protein